MIYSSDSDDDDVTQREEHNDFINSRSRCYRTVNATESFAEESQRIHERIKDLMKKNESVLVSYYYFLEFL